VLQKPKLEKNATHFSIPEEIPFPRPQKPLVFAGVKNLRFFKVFERFLQTPKSLK
jgi:hypothetical protein